MIVTQCQLDGLKKDYKYQLIYSTFLLFFFLTMVRTMGMISIISISIIIIKIMATIIYIIHTFFSLFLSYFISFLLFCWVELKWLLNQINWTLSKWCLVLNSQPEFNWGNMQQHEKQVNCILTIRTSDQHN